MIAMSLKCSLGEELFELITSVGRAYVDEVRLIGTSVSNKSALILAPEELRSRVLQLFRNFGIYLTCVVATEDIGTTAPAFSQRRVGHQRAIHQG